IREDVYQKNLRIILEAIKGRGIKTAERMIRDHKNKFLSGNLK
ncbi:unnamed protein product, partial [marine sediment metagenome]